jgi:hypothetical protein
MKLHVAHDETGRILGAGQALPRGDRPVARTGINIAEFEVPNEFEGKKPDEYLHRLRVDIRARQLVVKR